MTSRMIDYVYILDFTVISPARDTALVALPSRDIPSSSRGVTLETWHYRLGHLHHDMIKRMASKENIAGLKILDPNSTRTLCTGCALKKSKRHQFPINPNRIQAKEPDELIHANICGPFKERSISGSLCYILFKDEGSTYRFIFCITQKSEALTCLTQIYRELLRVNGHQILTLRTHY